LTAEANSSTGKEDFPSEMIGFYKDGRQINDIVDTDVEGICIIPDLRDKTEWDRKLWNKLIKIGRKLEPRIKGETWGEHKLSTPHINAILGTLDYYGATRDQINLASHDLKIAKYRIWDWLGMCYTGALSSGGCSKQTFNCIENMVKLYVSMENVGGFAWFLKGHDLDVEEPKKCKHCISSYKSWMKEVKQQGKNPNDYF